MDKQKGQRQTDSGREMGEVGSRDAAAPLPIPHCVRCGSRSRPLAPSVQVAGSVFAGSMAILSRVTSDRNRFAVFGSKGLKGERGGGKRTGPGASGAARGKLHVALQAAGEAPAD